MEAFEIVLKILQGGCADLTDTDWYSFLGFCDWHRITGYLADRLAADAVPAQARRRIATARREQKYRFGILYEAAARVGNALQKSGVRHAFLKGSVLTGRLYMPGERDSNDIDILCGQADLTAVDRVLQDLGYVQGLYRNNGIVPFSRAEIVKRRMNRGETAPYVVETGDALVPFAEIDVNFSLDWLPGTALTDKFLEHTQGVPCGLTGLDDVHHLLFLCMHQYKEATVLSMVRRMKDIELYKFLDIYLLQGHADAARFWQAANEYGLTAQCGEVLYQTGQLFPDMKLTAEKPVAADTVIDPEDGNKRYGWDADFLDRLCDTGRLKYLRAAAE
jgi:hypothetical protein